MKLEEVLPAYREGKVVVSCRGFRYQLGGYLTLEGAYNRELLGEWTIEKKKVKKEVRGWLNVYPSGTTGLYSTREMADDFAVQSHRIACIEFVHEYEVEE